MITNNESNPKFILIMSNFVYDFYTHQNFFFLDFEYMKKICINRLLHSFLNDSLLDINFVVSFCTEFYVEWRLEVVFLVYDQSDLDIRRNLIVSHSEPSL